MLSGALRQHWVANLYTLKKKWHNLEMLAPQNLLNAIQILLLASWHCHCPTCYYCDNFRFIYLILLSFHKLFCTWDSSQTANAWPNFVLDRALVGAGPPLKHVGSQGWWDMPWVKHYVVWLPLAPLLGMKASGAVAVLKQVCQSPFMITYNMMYFLRMPKLTLNASLCQGLLLVKSWYTLAKACL